MKEIKYEGIVRSAEEITGQKNCDYFSGDKYSYNTIMNNLAGQKIILTPCNDEYNNYDYFGGGFKWKAGWIKDIKLINIS